jgi:antitoxin VapB
MALSIKSDEADRLARELAAATGETLTGAVVASLRERLDRVKRYAGPSMIEQIRRLQVEARQHEIVDTRPAEEILGYDEHGLPT